MRVRVPMMIQDPLTSRYKGMRLVEEFFVDEEDFFLDGPVAKRVAVLDFDPDTSELKRGAEFMPPNTRRKLGRYKIPMSGSEFDIRSAEFMQVSAFGTVLRTMYMFEEPDAMGRLLVWAFGAPQLLIVPRAGEMANAYYERDSHSIQFFYMTNGGQPIYTGLSRDIISHETGHAILDGIAPDLYNAITPQSLALHEAVADLTALLMALRSGELRSTVLRQTNGSIENSTAFSSVAEEFGRALDRQGRAGYLRSLLNERTLDPDDRTTDELGVPNRVPRYEPHALSEVLSGALYKILVQLHAGYKARYVEAEGISDFSASGKALWAAGEQFKRMVFRALDYLPPGEISFGDYGRAIIAADQALYPDDQAERDLLVNEFSKRHMVQGPEKLVVQTNFEHPAVRDLDLSTLIKSDWAAYAFANEHRDFLNIPPHIPFAVRPRLEAIKEYWGAEGKGTSHECIFKVSWDVDEPNPMRPPFPGKRQITLGTTLAIDWDTHQVRALLTADQSDTQRRDRDGMLLMLDQTGALQLAHNAMGPDDKPLMSAVIAESANQLMRVQGAARMLHISPPEPEAIVPPPTPPRRRRPRRPREAAPDAGNAPPAQAGPTPNLDAAGMAEQSPFQGVPPLLPQSPFQGVPPMETSQVVQGFIPPLEPPWDAGEPDSPPSTPDEEKEG